MAGIDRRGVLRLAGAVGATGVAGWGASACATTAELSQTEPLYDSHVRVGLLVPEAGGYQVIGEDIVNGFQTFVAGNDNRLGGHPYVLHHEDEGESADQALAGAERLIEQGVHAIVGLATSAALREVGALAGERKVPVLGAHASPRDLQGVPYLWRTSYRNQEPGEALGGHLTSTVDGLVVAVTQDGSAGTDAIAGLQEAFAVAGASDQLAEPIRTPLNPQPADDFFTRVLGEVADLDPAAVFAVYAGDAATAFVRQYLAAGLDPERLYAPADLTEGTVLSQLGEELGDAPVGVRTAATYAPDLQVGSNRSFVVDYRTEFRRTPTTHAVAGHDAASALDKAIRLTEGDPTRRSINRMLGEVGLVDSPRGQWQFNQGRTPTQKWYLREVVADGPVLANVLVTELGTLG